MGKVGCYQGAGSIAWPEICAGAVTGHSYTRRHVALWPRGVCSSLGSASLPWGAAWARPRDYLPSIDFGFAFGLVGSYAWFGSLDD